MQPWISQPEGSATLAPAERFMLWALRAWVQRCKARCLPAIEVETAFAEIGLSEGAVALDAALRGVAQATRRPLLVHAPHCPALSDDEWLLLGAAAATQHQAFGTAHRLLSEIVHPVGADLVLGPLSSLGLMLALAGIDLPNRDAQDADLVFDAMPDASAHPTFH